MDVHIPSADYASMYGHSMRDMVQNLSITRLDLLVRESIQNSLDAGLSKKKNSCVTVKFTTGKFDRTSLNAELGPVGQKLNSRYAEMKCDFIAISDSDTEGLSGSMEDPRSKLRSLIYEIAKEQREPGSGGSRGRGKTTYFKIGIGLVIYYSTTSEHGKCKSLLAAVMAEEENGNPLVDVVNSRGLYFFGDYEPSENMVSYRTKTVPVTDEGRIENFLKIFGIEPNADGKTGTTVIIPYIDSDALLGETKPPLEAETGGRDLKWVSSLEDYLRHSIQKWYSPRLDNREYNGAFLKAFVNGKQIKRNGMNKLFRLISELYNVALNREYSSEFLQSIEVMRKDIKIHAVNGGVAGHLCAVYVDHGTVGLTNKEYRNAYSCIGDYGASLGSPILTFTRKAGMLVRYVTGDSRWVKGLNNLNADKLLICIFALASDSTLKGGTSLEEYIRAREKEDHCDWEEESGGSGVVINISDGVSRALKPGNEKKIDNQYDRRSKLSVYLTELFLPPMYESSIGAVGKKQPKTGANYARKSKLSGVEFKITSSTINNGLREVEFKLGYRSATNRAAIELRVHGENGLMDSKKWEEELDREFPISIEKITLWTDRKSPGGKNIHNVVDLSDACNDFEDLSTTILRSNMGVIYGISIDAKKAGLVCGGLITVRNVMESLSFNINCITEGRL